METQLLLHFLKFNIRSNSFDLKPWLEKLYAANDLTREFRDHCATLSLHVERADSPHAFHLEAPRDAVFAETNLCGGRCYYANGKFYSTSAQTYAHEAEFDVARDLIRANLSGDFGRSEQFVISNFVRPLLQSFILPFYGLKTLHGAVLARGDKTVFLSGGAGMGKSTTTLQLIENGWDVLSDDGPFFFLDEGRARVLSSLDYLHVTQNTLQMFPDFEKHVGGKIDSRQKFAVCRQNLQRGDTWKTPRQITDFVELQRGDFLTMRLRNGDRAAVFRALFHETMTVFRRTNLDEIRLPARDYSTFIFQLVSDVVESARVHRLEFGNAHLPQIPALLDSI